MGELAPMNMANWRSLLFVPADAQNLLARAHLRGADGLILDLEDGVGASAKTAAREGLEAVVAGLEDKGVDLLVRINVGWRAAFLDIAAAVRASVVALVIPKAEDSARLEVISAMVAEFESERGLPLGGIGLVALIESPLGLARAARLAAVPRVTALALGSEDFSLALGVMPTSEALELPCRQLALAAATRGLQCLAMPISIAELRDGEALGAAAERASAVGCTGALCVHPMQVQIANARFAPDQRALLAAENLVAAWERAQAAGKSVVQLEGAMIDKPVVERARRLLQRRRAS
jgi:citrate lyase subunit beta/citryl-CoA lyase